MKEFLFIHGKNPSLSRYELYCVFGEGVLFQSDLFSWIKTDQRVDQKMMNRLGGTTKICEVFEENPVDLIKEESTKKKILFGYSQYGGHDRMSDVLLSLKKEIKKRGFNARFLNKDFSNITSGQLNKSNILDKGADIVRCNFKGKEKWGKTLFFQDIDSYSQRDYEKPKRDMKVGMMPPKLCQMMINFSQAKRGGTIYDPFCGLGSILMEALLMGYKVMGSDIKGRLIHSTLKNLSWLIDTFSIPSTIKEEQFFQHDATQAFPGKKIPKDITVVTESYLGPPLSLFPDSEKQAEIFDLLHGINSAFFANISNLIPSKNTLVISFPFFKQQEKRVFYPEENIREYEQQGFRIQQELRSLLYERKNQVVGREIVVFEKL